MNVLSIFDGMSCGRIALDRAGIKVDNYYSSEIDKYANEVSYNNYPDIIRLGSVETFEQWELTQIDLLIGGSPCQGFSLAGKQLAFDDPRSALFFKYVECLKKFKPKYFLLENVKMKQEYIDIITDYLGVEPVEINSALVSAQNRKRLYWSNIAITQLEDKGIVLKDIIESGCVDREKSYCLDASYYKGSQNGLLYLKKARRQIVLTENETILHNLYGGFKENFPRIFNDKSPTLRTASGGGHIPSVFVKWLWQEKDIILKNRLLTPLEAERLQTVPDNYTAGVSNSQRYRCLGNGWTVDVIAGIFKNIGKEITPKQQVDMF